MKLEQIKINYKKWLFLTFHTSKVLSWADFDYHTKRLIDWVKKKYKGVGYVCAIECHEKGFHYHSHIIFIFQEGKPKYDRSWWKGIWNLGKVCCKGLNKSYEYNLAYYLTKKKNFNIQNDKPWLSKFPNGAHIIRTGRKLEKVASYSFYTTKDKLKLMLTEGKRVGAGFNYDSHKYKGKTIISKVHLTQANDLVKQIGEAD